MALTNRPGGLLVTRGLGGPTTQVIVRGFLPLLAEQIEDELIKRGRSYKKHRTIKFDEETKEYYEEYNIYVELSAINGKDLFDPIINKIKQRVDNHNIDISASASKLVVKSPDIVINVKMTEKNNVIN